MTEARLERIEGLMTQLITMVGNMNQTMQSMQQEMQTMKQDISTLKQDNKTIKQEIQALHQYNERNEKKQDERYNEVINRLKALEIDQDFIWEKTARNERDLGVLKRRLS